MGRCPISRLVTIALAAALIIAGTWRATTSRQQGSVSTPTPHRLGKLATPAQIAAQDITVFPDGRGLPPGRGTAREGAGIYAARCAVCHGPRGEGTPNFPQLAGGRGSLTTNTPVLTVGSYWPFATTLWDYTRRAMPYLEPGSLTTSETYAVTAFVLYLNGIVDEDFVLDERTLPHVKMPNRDGFFSDPRGPGKH
jgi:S-disulfanyl-L-cysteine oxidoreductase SoxD